MASTRLFLKDDVVLCVGEMSPMSCVGGCVQKSLLQVSHFIQLAAFSYMAVNENALKNHARVTIRY